MTALIVDNLNVMLKNDNQAFLIDFGLAYKFKNNKNEHNEYEKRLERRHKGTLEYTSLDAYSGARKKKNIC